MPKTINMEYAFHLIKLVRQGLDDCQFSALTKEEKIVSINLAIADLNVAKAIIEKNDNTTSTV